jgi:hypothetical protein
MTDLQFNYLILEQETIHFLQIKTENHSAVIAKYGCIIRTKTRLKKIKKELIQ